MLAPDKQWFFRRFFGNYKQILAEILRKILAELDGKIAELGQHFGSIRLHVQGFCLILAKLGYFCKVFV